MRFSRWRSNISGYRVKDTYVVDLDDESCTCPDFEFRGQPCKHLYAVENVASDA